jgi:hypothetical protein
MMFVLAFAFAIIDIARCANLLSPVRRLKSNAACDEKVDGCASGLEIKQGESCVMADTLPQYEIGDTIEKTVSNFQSMLTEYYGDISVLERMLNMSDAGGSVLVEKMRNALARDKTFIVAAVGSSVTAAHDNCHIDGYPTQLESLLKPLFEQAGVKFESRNSGIGGSCGDSFFDQVPCLAQVVGEDVDVTSFSWDYWADNPEFQEHFIRTSLTMPKSPMPLLITLNKHHYPSHEQFFQRYGHLGYHALAGTMSTPAGVPSLSAKSETKFGFVGDGWHKVTRVGDKFPLGSCRRQSTSVLWRNWHGGPLLYQLMADAMGWTYVKALKEALRAGPQDALIAKPMVLPQGLKSNISEPPRCISFTEPNVYTWKGGAPAVKLIEEKSEDVKFLKKDVRKDMLPETERQESRCEHLDVCGVAKSNLITVDLRAKHKKPLAEGKLVVCIGGGPPAGAPRALLGSAEEARWESSKSIAALPPPAVFPRCDTGSLQSIKVDGKELELSSATKWAESAEGSEKCGVFELASKNARLVAVQSASCGITHVFAM